MAVLCILPHTHPRYRHQAAPVHKVSIQIQKLCADMLDTMHANGCCGLAATQVGVLKRVCVLAADAEAGGAAGQDLALINPVILKPAGEVLSEEYSPTFPGLRAVLRRAASFTVRFRDLKNRPRELQLCGNGLWIRALQHEVDHLDGVLMIDRAENREEIAT